MPQGSTLQVKDFQKFMKLVSYADKTSQKEIRNEIRKAGEHVRLDGARLFAPTDAKSAAGYRTIVRQRGVAVEQKYRKTTGKHPNFGGLQMRRALIPALTLNEARTVQAVEQAMDRIAARFNNA